MSERIRKHMVGYKIRSVNGKPRTEIPGRLSDDEYEAMSASLKGKRIVDGRVRTMKGGDYSVMRDRRLKYVERETGRKS